MRDWIMMFLDGLEGLAAWRQADAGARRRASELVCQVFDDSGVMEELALGPVFSTAIDQKIRDMSALADEVPDPASDGQLEACVSWRALCHMAGQVAQDVRAYHLS